MMTLPEPNKTFILINGPARIGKTTLADELKKVISKAERINMADHLKTMVHVIYGYPADPSYFEAVKDQPNLRMGGMTPRQAYIHWSEKFAKKLHGVEFYGNIAVEKAAEKPPGSCILMGDAGFAVEMPPFIRRFGGQNILLVRLYGRDKTFAGDSRSYVHWKDVVASSVKASKSKLKYRIGSPTPIDFEADRFHEIEIENVEGRLDLALNQILTAYQQNVLGITLGAPVLGAPEIEPASFYPTY